MTIKAVFEGGVFRPLEAVSLPENTQVELAVEAPIPQHKALRPGQKAIYDVLSRTYAGDDPRVSERHNEHQP